ncbi:IS256 family transposase [uncultured Mitsuokella sp.]|uniref:IS256 family transposase n=1 Tax=uncultured Mitsuokella sp. TaxID=453120 RepID=UPI002613D519|nr:IS256 family transposase [uncultured Mitsuokella sp.]
MAKRKTPPTTPGEQIAQQILDNYDIKSAEDVQDVLKQIFAPIFESMLKGEMENHLGHKNHERSEDGGNVRNGYSSKRLKTSLGEVPIRVPRDRQSTFEPQIIKKHQRDVSSIEGKVLAMYARGMSQRDIAATIEDIYGFQMSHEQISTITDCVTEEVEAWRNRPLQRCIVHLIRNSIRYIPRKQWSAFTKQLKLIYGAINVKQARQEFEKFKTDWQAYPGAVSVWENNFSHVEQLYNYGSAVRKIMYTTNAIESVNSSFRKVTKKGAFPNEDAVFKIFYLRILELYKKWEGRHVANWAMVRNQLLMDDRMSQLMQQYDVAY